MNTDITLEKMLCYEAYYHNVIVRMPVVLKHAVFCGGSYIRCGWRGRDGDTE